MRPVGVDPHDLAKVGGEILRLRPSGEDRLVAEPDEQRSIGGKRHAPAILQRRVERRVGAEDHANAVEPRRGAIDQRRAGDGEAAAAAARFGETPEQLVVGGEVR